MAIETLGGGFQNGYNWTVDHDETAGTIGVTVTDNGAPDPGVLMLHGDVTAVPSGTTVGTINPIRIDTFDNQGRQILFTNNQLKNVVLVGSSVPFSVNLWTTFGTA